MKNNPQWKKLLALVLCVVQCMVLVVPAAAAAQVNTPDAIAATSLACDAPVRVTMKEESSYWFGNASQATVTLGEPITNISDRDSIILDSPVEEGYGEKTDDASNNEGQTSSYFLVDMNWAKIDVDKQDVMFYIELPAEATSIRIASICVSSWKYPDRPGMAYEYLESDGTSWVKGNLDGNGHIALTKGFKGYIRLLINTAADYADFKDTTSVQSFGFRIDKFGGSFGPAKLGGMWIVSKGEYYEVSVDGGEMVPLTTAQPLPQPGNNADPGWTGPVLSGKHQLHANNVTMEKNPSGQVTVTLADGITKLGEKNSYVVDSSVPEGYANPAGTTDAFINMLGSWIGIDLTSQDFMFYIELPAASKELRVHGITATADKYYWPSVWGMRYQYLSVDSTEWMDGKIETDNKVMALPQGFKGFIRLKMETLNNYASLPSNLSIYSVQFRVDRFGGDDGAVKISSGWVVSREESRYISISGGSTICMTDPAEPTWIQASAVSKETAAPGEAAATTTWSKPGWGAVPEVTMTVGDCINPLADGQKSIAFDSAKQEGYFASPATYAHIVLKTNEPTVNMAKQQIMIYVELPQASSSFRVDSFVFYTGSNKLSVYSPKGVKYSYLSADGSEWVNGGAADGNYQFNVPAGFKGYVRFDVTTSANWWWQNNEGNEAWKQTSAKFTQMTIFFERYGADLGQAKVGGLWVVNKADFIDASVNGGQAKPMTSYVPEPFVPKANSASLEYAQHLWTAKVTASGGAATLLDANYVDICDVSALRITSNAVNGYANGGSGAANIKMDTDIAEDQDVLFYVELPKSSAGLRVQGTEVVSYKYTNKGSEGWVAGTVGENGQIDLPTGFKGYVRLDVNTEHLDNLIIAPDAFGGDLGYVLLGGIWLASGGDYAYVSVDGANPAMIYFEWFDVEKQPSDFSIAIIPDQQVMTYYYPEKLTNMYNWIADQIEPENVQMILNLGDMTETNSTDNWAKAKEVYNIIAGKAPFMFVPGNHDYEGGATAQSTDYRNLTNLNTYFPLSMFREMETYGGAYSEAMGTADDTANTWQTLEYNGYKYLFVALEFGPRDSVLEWAGDVIAAHPDYQTIIFTHGYLDGAGERLDGTSGSGSPSTYKFIYSETDPANDADGMWDKLVRKYENIVMVLSGHIGVDNVVCTTAIGDNGNEVKEFLIDGQWLDRDLYGVGLVAMMNFSNGGKTVEFTYYSTDRGQYMNKVNQFTFTLPAQNVNYAAQVGEQTYTTVTEAIANANGQIVTILADSDEAITVSADVTIDLAGFDLSNVTVAEGAKLNLIDSTATFDGVNGSAAVTGNVEFLTEADGNKYMVIGEDGVYAAHLYDFGITHVSLKPGVTGFGYKAGFYGDAAVQAQIASVGFELWLTEDHVVGRSMDGYKEQVTLRLQNFLVSEYGEAPVNAKVVMTLTDGTKLESQTVSYSMRSMLEQVNTNIAQFNDAQIRAVQGMLAPYADAVSAWNIFDILHWSFAEAA